MNINEFKNLVELHSLAKDNLLYNANALAGETGEVCNQVKKVEMNRLKPEWATQRNNRLPNAIELKNSIEDELGDALFYLIRVILDNGSSLEDVMQLQADKLKAQSIKYGRTFLK
jgi:NTP pyrophosphatase (non-canonical NTP hydrolase)